jgi:hypothetical protein
MRPRTEFATDRRGRLRTQWTFLGPPSKPLVGILGDVDGRIVPVAPPPLSNSVSDRHDGHPLLTAACCPIVQAS